MQIRNCTPELHKTTDSLTKTQKTPIAMIQVLSALCNAIRRFLLASKLSDKNFRLASKSPSEPHYHDNGQKH